MEIHPENEPLLSKDNENDIYLNIKNVKNNKKSKEQIINKNCYDCLEYICFCCYNYDITQNQYESHLSLSKKCSIPYNPQDESHEKLLLDFFTTIKELVPKIEKEEDEEEYNLMDKEDSNNINTENENNNIIKEISQRIGFQNEDPRTDFRAGGVFSLEFINYFINNYKNDSRNILKEQYFPFGIVCINLCYKICLILHLVDKEKVESQLKINKIKGCTRKEMKNFCEHLENEEENDLLLLIISICLSFVFAKYLNNFDVSKKNENLLIINEIIDNSLEHLRKTLRIIKKNEKIGDKLLKELTKAKNEKIIIKS